MDVKFTGRSFFLLLILFIASACNPEKTTQEVFPNKNQDFSCQSEALIKNKFIVSYENGHVELVEAENADIFEERFLKPRLNEIKYVEYDQVIHLSPLSNPQDISLQAMASDGFWGPENIKASFAWDEDIKGQNVKVAVVDAAIDYTQPQLAGRLSPNLAEVQGQAGVDNDGNGYVNDRYGWDFYKNQPQPDPYIAPGTGQAPNIHGTHVAGIILADPNFGDVHGVAPAAELIPVNFMDEDGGGKLSDAILAIKYAASRGAQIINASWGGPGCSETLRQTLLDVSTKGNNGKGVLIVAAAGNDGVDFDRSSPAYYTYPAVFNLPNQLTIAANDFSDFLTSFSNKSYHLVHFSAPGLGINSTVPYRYSKTGVEVLSGTSMATPFVSGAAALLWSAKPTATASQIKQALIKSTDFKSMKVVTQGRLNVQRALAEIRRTVP